jgi:hypothetical protein
MTQVEKVIPYCKGVIGRASIDFSGQPPKKATLLNVIGNSFILSMIETIAEGQVVAEKTGLGVKELHQFIKVIVSRSVCGVLQSNAITRLL